MLNSMDALSTNRAGRVYRRLRALLFPTACLFCHAPLPGDGYCPDCYAEVHVWPHGACVRCGTPLPEGMGRGICGRCFKRPPAQQQTESLYVYHGPVREAILDWKLNGRDAGVRWLFHLAVPRVRDLIGAGDLVLPVPMPLSRMRQSGQHHAASLSRWLAQAAGCSWDWRILRRHGEQPRQSSLTGAARRRNLRKAFELDHDYLAQHRLLPDVQAVWIVDDILTTGATLHFAARAAARLQRPVKVLSLARTKQEG